MKRVTLLLTFLLFTSISFAQEAFSIKTDSLSSWLSETYNISEMTQGFYDCVSENELSSEITTKGIFHCIDLIVMRDAKYTDEGIKAMKLFKTPWLNACSRVNMELGSKVTEYCNCLFSSYQEESMGMKEIVSAEFQGSSANKGFKKACKEKSGID